MSDAGSYIFTDPKNWWRNSAWSTWWRAWRKKKAYEKCFLLALYTLFPFGNANLIWIYTSIPHLLVFPAFFFVLGVIIWAYTEGGGLGRTMVILLSLASTGWLFRHVGFSNALQGLWSGIVWFFGSIVLYWRWLFSHLIKGTR